MLLPRILQRLVAELAESQRDALAGAAGQVVDARAAVQVQPLQRLLDTLVARHDARVHRAQARRIVAQRPLANEIVREVQPGPTVQEDGALQRLQDYRKALIDAQVYPVSFVWKTDYWTTISNALEDAQRNKLDHVCRKARLAQLERIDEVLGMLVTLVCVPVSVTGAVVGFVNGVLITRVRIDSFIATLAVSFIIFGFGYIVSDGAILRPVTKEWANLARTNVLGITSATWIAIVVTVVTVLGGQAAMTIGHPLPPLATFLTLLLVLVVSSAEAAPGG